MGSIPVKRSTIETQLNVSLLLCFIFFFTTGCSYQKTCNDPALGSEENIYKIAVAAPQFGPYEALGLSIVYGAELAVEVKNQNGGINGKKIKLIKVDDGGLAHEGTWRAKSLVGAMVLGVIGHLNSDISIPASLIYSKAMIAEISPASTSPLFTERKLTRGYVFRTIGRDDMQGEIAASYVTEKGFKKIAVLYNNRSYGHSLASEFIKGLHARSKDIDIVFYKAYKVGAASFKDYINILKTKEPEILFFAGEYGDAALLLKDLKKSGLKTAFLGSEGVFDEEFISSSGRASEEALVISLVQTKDSSFIENYKKKFGKDLGAYSSNSFDAANILISAIEKVKVKSPELVAKVIRETKNYPGISGEISFDDKGDLVNPGFLIYKVENGMFVATR